MKRQLTVAALILVGLVLLLLGFQWTNVVPTGAYWSAEQGTEFMAAQADLHAKIDRHSEKMVHQRDLEAAKDRFVKINSQLESARGSQGFTANILKAVGIFTVACGIGLHFAAASDS